MKNTILCLVLILTSTIAFGQTAYIQVNGEADLSVYLNDQFKGKTSAELKGLIIEQVTPGKNLIKIVKEGYTPFEEYITVKPGEVFAYNVKPFTKHIVSVSQQGHTGETEGKVKLETGKLVIQSVPIEIKITIPAIEGIDNNQKNKDEWLADEIPTGNYSITFTYGEKVITKTIQIQKDSITSIFVNMLNGEFVVKFKEKLPYETREETIAYINQLLSKQGTVTYGYYHGSGNKYLQNKVNQHSHTYGLNALSYSKESKTYSLAYSGSYLTWGITNNVPYEIKGPLDYTYTSSFKGLMTFEGVECDNREIVSGSCNGFLVRSTAGTSHLRIYLTGKDPNIVPSLKKAFLHLNELNID